MRIVTLDHYNLRAPRAVIDELRDFYRDVVGLRIGDRPPFKSFGYWLYSEDRPVLHLSESRADEERSRTAVNTFSHAAFNCTGRAAFERRLREHGIEYRVADVPLMNIDQLFFVDPAGNGVELQFDAADRP